ncbi:MAG: hypothetical protein KGZ97_09770 [Bacteroidetes bacterium]|nr:hypothetical protein [Bacteroidota bacterium]
MTVDGILKWARENYDYYAEFVKSPESLQNVILQGLQQRKNLNALQLLDFFFLMKFGRKRKVEHSRGKWTVEGLRTFEKTGKPGQGRKLI